jgi:hypothetical protein
MFELLYLALFGFGITYALWLFFLAVMNLKQARDEGLLNKTALTLGYPILVIGYLLDALVNVSVMTLLFLEIPQELTVTSRLKRHINTGSGWRLNLASWFKPLLNPFDAGHI